MTDTPFHIQRDDIISPLCLRQRIPLCLSSSLISNFTMTVTFAYVTSFETGNSKIYLAIHRGYEHTGQTLPVISVVVRLVDMAGEHELLTQSRLRVGPLSKTVTQHEADIGSASRVFSVSTASFITRATAQRPGTEDCWLSSFLGRSIPSIVAWYHGRLLPVSRCLPGAMNDYERPWWHFILYQWWMLCFDIQFQRHRETYIYSF